MTSPRRSPPFSTPARLPRIGPYDVVREIGRGGMGAVLEVRHRETGASYALKLVRTSIDDEARAERILARFQREIELLARVDDHPGIVRIHGCGVETSASAKTPASGGDGARRAAISRLPWCVMELVHGEALSARLQDGPLDPREAARLVADVADAVEHAHRLGVLHRDLKPGNVILDERAGRPRVVDFGLAYDVAADRLTLTGEMVGTPAFMAPEQVHRASGDEEEAASEGRLGPATDVYGLGAILYACLTGDPPFRADVEIALVMAVVENDPEPPSRRNVEVPAMLERICLAALAKDPADRPATAGAFRDDLEAWLRGETPAVASRRPPSALRRWLRRPGTRRVVAIAVAAIAAAVLLGGVALVIERRASAAREEREERARVEAGFEAAFAAAVSGDLDALEEARSRVPTIRAQAADDPLVEDRCLVVETLAALASGDEARARTLPLGAERWRPYRHGVVAVLLAADRPRALALVIERAPDLLDEDAVRDALAAAMTTGAVRPTERLAEVVLAALERDGAAGGDAHGELAVAVLGRALELVLAGDGPVDQARVDRLAARLAETLRARADPPRPPIGEAALARLAALVTSAATWEGEAASSDAVALAEVVIAASRADDPALHPVVERLLGRTVQGIAPTGVGDDERIDAFRAGALLQRIGRFPFMPESLAEYSPGTTFVKERLAELLARDPVPFDEVVTAAAVLFKRGLESIARERGLHGPPAVLAALLELWPAVAAVLGREQARGDVPGWVLAWTSWAIERASPWMPTSNEETEVERRELLTRLQPLLPDGALLDTVESFYRRASERERSRPEVRRHHGVFLAHLRFVARRRLGAVAHPDPEVRARAECLRVARQHLELVDELLRLALGDPASGLPSMRLGGYEQAGVARVVHGYGIALAVAEEGHEEEPGPGCADAEHLARLTADLRRLDGGSPRAGELESLHLVRHGRYADAYRSLGKGPIGTADQIPALFARLVGARVLLDEGQAVGAKTIVIESYQVRGVPADLRAARIALAERLGLDELAAADRKALGGR